MTALTTAYRPGTFKEVIGHTSVLKALKKTVKEGRARAFIFTGDSGLGKTTLARIMANEFAVRGKVTEELLANVNVANIIEIDAATHTGVDAMREVVSKTRYRALGGSPVKAIIVDEAHRISAAAWDSMLKSIEEPPPHVYWFFCTTNAGKIPKTVKTRCQVYDLKPLSEDDILLVLGDVIEKAKLEIEDEVLEAIAENSGGSPRQALSFLEQVEFCETSAEALRIMRQAGDSKEVSDLMRALLGNKPSWASLMVICKSLEESGTEAESIRIVASNYLAKVAAGAKSDKAAANALRLIYCFSRSYNPTDKFAPLYLSLGEAVGMD